MTGLPGIASAACPVVGPALVRLRELLVSASASSAMRENAASGVCQLSSKRFTTTLCGLTQELGLAYIDSRVGLDSHGT